MENKGRKRAFDDNYDDIIHLPVPESKTHPRMSIQKRAAQFSPFAAVTGHEEAVREKERITEEWNELDESRKEVINTRLQIILKFIALRPEITLIYFEPDQRKRGGAYVDVTGIVKKIDEYRHEIILENGERIEINKLYDIRGNIFGEYEHMF